MAMQFRVALAVMTVLVAVVLTARPDGQTTPLYAFNDIGVSYDVSPSTSGFAINEIGQVLGHRTDGATGAGKLFIFHNGALTDLPVHFGARSLSNFGLIAGVVGEANTGCGGFFTSNGAAVYSLNSGVLTALKPSAYTASAFVNDAGLLTWTHTSCGVSPMVPVVTSLRFGGISGAFRRR